jgi:hypothetical protein
MMISRHLQAYAETTDIITPLTPALIEATILPSMPINIGRDILHSTAPTI